MRSIIVRTVLAISLGLVAVSGVTWAQDEGITLESLAEAIAQITGRVDSHDERIAAIETAIAPTPIPTPTPTLTPDAEAIRLARLLAVNDYLAADIFFPDLPDAEQVRLIDIYLALFVDLSSQCELDHQDMFWMLQKNANIAERRGIRPHLGTWRDQVKGGGARYYWLKNMTANPLVRDYIAKDHFEGALGESSKQGRCESYITRDL